MLVRSREPQFPLPQGWPASVKSAVIIAISLAHYAIVYARGWAVDSRTGRVRLKAERNRALQEVALLHEQDRIKDVRMALIPPHRRPHFPPTERMAITPGWDTPPLREGHGLCPSRACSARPSGYRLVRFAVIFSTFSLLTGVGIPSTFYICAADRIGQHGAPRLMRRLLEAPSEVLVRGFGTCMPSATAAASRKVWGNADSVAPPPSTLQTPQEPRGRTLSAQAFKNYPSVPGGPERRFWGLWRPSLREGVPAPYRSATSGGRLVSRGVH